MRAEVGDVQVRIVKPVGAPAPLPAVLYVHGGGWILGNAGTHDRLVRELAVGTNAASCSSSTTGHPKRIPGRDRTGLRDCTLDHPEGRRQGLDASRLAVAGDSVGGNMTVALAILAKQRGDIAFVHQSMYYPVTDAAQDTESYASSPRVLPDRQVHGVVLGRVLPDETTTVRDHRVAPAATLDDLAGLPEAFVIVDENDVLRDEGEAYARKLTEAGVRTTSVRFNGVIHDFLMLNPVRETAASTAAIEQAIHVLRKALGTD